MKKIFRIILETLLIITALCGIWSIYQTFLSPFPISDAYHDYVIVLFSLSLYYLIVHTKDEE